MNNQAMILDAFGYSINLMSVMIVLLLVGLITLFVRIQLSEKLDFADMLTKDGKAVSLTKVLQLVGGVTATWVIIKTTLTGDLGMDIFASYLAYVASIEGFSKFVAAKYQYRERSMREAQDMDTYYQGQRPSHDGYGSYDTYNGFQGTYQHPDIARRPQPHTPMYDDRPSPNEPSLAQQPPEHLR